MKKIGITGQNGFIGSHLYRWISILYKDFKLIEFNLEYYVDYFYIKCYTSKVRLHGLTPLIFHYIYLSRLRTLFNLLLFPLNSNLILNPYRARVSEGQNLVSGFSKVFNP